MIKIWRYLIGGRPAALTSVVPKTRYDVIIIGGGLVELACAYYLAKEHGVRDVVVMASGRLGGGAAPIGITSLHPSTDILANTDENAQAAAIWAGLPRELGFKMPSKGDGVMELCRDQAEFDLFARIGNVLKSQGENVLLCDYGMVEERAPQMIKDAKTPVFGGLWREWAGAKAQSFMAMQFGRAAQKLGVDLIENCEATEVSGGVQTVYGMISGKVVVSKADVDIKAMPFAGFSLANEIAQNVNVEQ